MQGAGDENVVRVFYIPYARSLQQFQELVTVVRSTAGIRRFFIYNAPRAVAARGTADQIAAAAWLFEKLGEPATPNSTVPEYRMPGGNDDSVRIFHVPNAKTTQAFQEVVTVVRAVADIPRMFTYDSTRAVVSRGTADQLALAQWLVNELDKPGTHATASSEYRMADANENIVRVFYLPPDTTLEDFQKFATSLRTTTEARRSYTYKDARAIAMRGTMTQINHASELAADRAKPN